MTVRVAIPDMVSPSYFPAIAAVRMGICADHGVDAAIELVFPVTRTYEMLASDEVNYVGGAAHAVLYGFPHWRGVEFLCSLSQCQYWFLVASVDKVAEGADAVESVRGLRIGAAPGPVDGLRLMVEDAGLDPDDDVELCGIPAGSDGSASFGVAAAHALANGAIDAFWANGMGAAVAVANGTGTVVIDARRGGGPAGTDTTTFASFATSATRADKHRGEAVAMASSIIEAQRILREDPERAVDVVDGLFPTVEQSLIAALVRKDSSFYDPTITEAAIARLNTTGRRIGLLDGDTDVRLDDLTSPTIRELWNT